jgi:hypothetical protein
MMDSAKHRYPAKLPELVSNIRSKISAIQVSQFADIEVKVLL